MPGGTRLADCMPQNSSWEFAMPSIFARRVVVAAASLIAFVIGVFQPVAATIYTLDNKYWGALNPPNYGVRVNGLEGGTWTYDYAHAQSDVVMKVVDNGGADYDLHIYGSVYGGKHLGDSYATDTTGLWALDFWYTDGVQIGSSGILVDKDVAHGGQGVGAGTLVYEGAGNLGGYLQDNTDPIINIAAFSGKYSFSFCYGDVADFGVTSGQCGTQTHPVTGESVYKGAGWLLNSAEFAGPAIYDHGDFGFTGQVPEPSTLALLGFGIAGLGFARRRRRV